MKHLWAWVFLLAAVGAGCGGKPKVVLPPPTPARIGASERGTASWYGHPYHGRRTSNGEVYDMDGLTAAHLSLPFNTIVRVRNLANGRSVDVRINDRGPFLKGRLIDVSREAARRIEMIGPGTTRVEVTVVGAPTTVVASIPEPDPPAAQQAGLPCSPNGGYAVQVGAFASRPNAEKLALTLQPEYPVLIHSAPSGDRTVYRVYVGSGVTRGAADSLLAALRRSDFNGFVVEALTSGCNS